MSDAHNPQLVASQSTFAQLTTATRMLALVSRYQNDARLQNLFDNLWLDGKRFGSHMTPAGLVNSPIDCEQVPRGDRWTNEIPALFCSHLTSHAVWPSDEICKLLEQNVDMFREEFASIDPNEYQVDARDHLSGLTDGRNWTVFPLYDGYANLFSIMNPKTHVPPHASELNTRVRYHLGIEVPERDIHFRIHDQLITWKQDRCIKIDDSYQHEVFQQSDRRRVVFVLDVPHPELRPEELEFLQEFMRCTTAAGRR